MDHNDDLSGGLLATSTSSPRQTLSSSSGELILIFFIFHQPPNHKICSQQYRPGAQILTWRTFASVLFRSIGAYDDWLCCGLTEMGNRDNPRLSKIAHQLGNLKAITTYSTILKILFWRFITYHDLFCPQVRPSSVGSYSRRSSWCYQGGGDQTLVSENSHSDQHHHHHCYHWSILEIVYSVQYHRSFCRMHNLQMKAS